MDDFAYGLETRSHGGHVGLCFQKDLLIMYEWTVLVNDSSQRLVRRWLSSGLEAEAVRANTVFPVVGSTESRSRILANVTPGVATAKRGSMTTSLSA